MNILLPTHIIIASASVLYSIYIFFRPSQNKLKASYGLIATTVISGTYLIALTQTHISQVCTTGLVYIGISLIGVFITKNKLASQKLL